MSSILKLRRRCKIKKVTSRKWQTPAEAIGNAICYMFFMFFFSLAFFRKRLYIKHIIYIHAYISLAHVSLRISLESQVDIFIFWNKKKIQSYFPQHQVCTDTSNPTTLFIVKRFKILVSFLLVFLLDFICPSSELGCLCVSVDEHPRNGFGACSHLFFPQYLFNTG